MPIRERNGKWHYRFQIGEREWTGTTGLAAVEKNRLKAERKEAQIRQQIEAGKEPVKVQTILFTDALDRFMVWAAGEHRHSPGAYSHTQSALAAARAFFTNRPVHQITAGRVEDYKAWRRTGNTEIQPVAEVTLRHNLHQLGKFFRYAMKQGWTATNPVKEVEIPSDADAVRMKVLTDDEEKRYFLVAEKNLALHDTGRLMIQQGMRPDEVYTLQKQDVDLINNTVRIRGRQIEDDRRRTKTLAGTRTLPLTQESAAILAKWLTKSPESRWVFPSPKLRGQPMGRPHNTHARVCELAKVEFVPYDLRHTFATRAAAKGVPPSTLAKLLGHKDLKTIMRYVHPRQEDLHEAMRLVDAPSGFRPDATANQGENHQPTSNNKEKEEATNRIQNE
jgi:integrase